MRKRRAPRLVIPRALPRAAITAARDLIARETAAARVGRHAERSLAIALRRYIPRADGWTDRALIEAVAASAASRAARPRGP